MIEAVANSSLGHPHLGNKSVGLDVGHGLCEALGNHVLNTHVRMLNLSFSLRPCHGSSGA